MMKVVFLDIDGVLNKTTFGEDLYHDTFGDADLPLHMDCVDNLKMLIESDPDIKIVWSTDWRHYDDAYFDRWKNPRLWLESQDWMKGRVIGKTPKKMSSEHFHDIKWWLDAHRDVKKYVILEDGYFPEDWFGLEKHLVQTDSEKGFDKHALTKAMFTLF